MATTTTNTPATALCGGHVSSRRGLLASLWTLVTLLTAISFVVALIFTLSAHDASGDDDADNNNNNQNNNNDQTELAITNRAMAFCALWTAVLATLLAIFGTVILGWQSPTGQYYTCCAAQVHRTTPLALGSFIGALIMFANLTLVCSVLFGEFEIRDYQREGGGDPDRQDADTAVHRSSLAFSIMCMVLTVLYAGFAALTFLFSETLLEEMQLDDHDAPTTTRSNNMTFLSNTGYIGERFDVVRTNFVQAPPTANSMSAADHHNNHGTMA